VLLVEDNANNQQIACGLLEAEGAIVTIAGDGQEAIEQVGSARLPFDAVLMDLQMPRMDGLVATRRIRALGHDALPVIAMTANAMASDAQACREAGMNAHVGKPFHLDHLVQVLRRHAGRPGGESLQAAGSNSVTVSADEQAAAASAGVQLATALARLGGDRNMLARLLDRLVDDLARWPAELRRQHETGAFDAARRVLHTAKGLCASAGAQALSQSIASAERRLAGTEMQASWAAAVVDIGQAMASARPGLAALVRVMPAAAPAGPAEPADKLDLADRLGSLKTLLANADMGATRAMDELKRNYATLLGRHILPLDESIHTLDFERALRHCAAAIDDLASEPQ
jgi:CheY-like chemotaxis protein